MQFGSLVNTLTNHAGPEPEVGMGATILCWTDRHVATVVEVVKNKAGVVTKVTLRQDKAHRVDSNGMSEVQDYRYEADPAGHEYVFTKRSDGRFRELGAKKGQGYGVSFGERREYHDYSF